MRAYRHTTASSGIRLLTRHLIKMRTVIVPILVVAALTLAAPRAEAVIVAPGATVPAAGIVFPGGTELDSVFYENVGAANLVVDVASAVYDNAGFLDFYYQVSNDSAENLVHRLTASSFTEQPEDPLFFITDVWFVTNGEAVPCAACPGGFFETGTQDPLTFDSDAVGEVVGFNFPTLGFEVDPGETSLLLLIQTNATFYAPGFVSVSKQRRHDHPAGIPALCHRAPDRRAGTCVAGVLWYRLVRNRSRDVAQA